MKKEIFLLLFPCLFSPSPRLPQRKKSELQEIKGIPEEKGSPMMEPSSYGLGQVLRRLFFPHAPTMNQGHDVISRISGQQKDSGQSLEGMISLYSEVAVDYDVVN